MSSVNGAGLGFLFSWLVSFLRQGFEGMPEAEGQMWGKECGKRNTLPSIPQMSTPLGFLLKKV